MSKDIGVFLGTSVLLVLLIFVPIWIGKGKKKNLSNTKSYLSS